MLLPILTGAAIDGGGEFLSEVTVHGTIGHALQLFPLLVSQNRFRFLREVERRSTVLENATVVVDTGFNLLWARDRALHIIPAGLLVVGEQASVAVQLPCPVHLRRVPVRERGALNLLRRVARLHALPIEL